jgi:hypothetical protein
MQKKTEMFPKSAARVQLNSFFQISGKVLLDKQKEGHISNHIKHLTVQFAVRLNVSFGYSDGGITNTVSYLLNPTVASSENMLGIFSSFSSSFIDSSAFSGKILGTAEDR